MLLEFPKSFKLRARFQFYEMWCKYKDSNQIVDLALLSSKAVRPSLQLRDVLIKIRPLLSKLNKDNFAHLRTQQDKDR